MNKRIIMEGRRSFRENKGRYVNPYQLGTSESNYFERGWTQALKISPEPRRCSCGANKAPKRNNPPARVREPTKETKKKPDHLYQDIAKRAREKLLRDPLYRPPNYSWAANVYYIRIEKDQKRLWKIGVTCNNLDQRYRVADRRNIFVIRSWHYATREEAEAIEREILADFAEDVYDGCRVLQSGGDSELFNRDVLELDDCDN